MSRARRPSLELLGVTEPRGVVDGAFALLRALRIEGGEARLTTLARRTGLPNATAHRLLKQLADVGAVERRANAYSLGATMGELGEGWEPSPGLRATARQPLRQLAAVGSHTALMVTRGDRLLVLEEAGGGPKASPDPRAHVATLNQGLATRDRAIARGQPNPDHACVAAAVRVTHEPGLVAVTALLPADGPADLLLAPVGKIASMLARPR